MRINKLITAILVLIAGASVQGVIGAQPAQESNVYRIMPVAMPQEQPVIAMTDDAQFYPSQMVVPVGTTVIWQNASGLIHTVTDTPGGQSYRGDALLPPGAAPFDSGNIAPGAFYSYTFSIPGTYVYFCRHHEHEGMVGQITVTPQ
jgi:plastocyanin